MLGGNDILEMERFPIKLRTMTDEDLWWFFVQNRERCPREFWEEVENRKAAGILSETSPFWGMGASLAQRERLRWFAKWNVIYSLLKNGRRENGGRCSE